MYMWMQGNVFHMQITLSRSSLTLNTAACSRFQDCRYVRLGLDPDSWKLAVQPVRRDDLELGAIPMDQVQKITLGKGYGRISNRKAVEQIEHMVGRSCEGEKFACIWDEGEGLLLADLSHMEDSL